ncbi:hypothetical protein GCM10023084_81590 [Streptomyces lacrimifluminis]|uniref:Transposase n=1 Tax=Streptomyces lacrimifluminis TaxID=1500077 RepID=A0A917PD40_9ACTN|nr:hypothetical protein GCM10012282_80420 [Streptomyces lacrimifluminis]
MVFKLVESAQARWRAVNAPHLVALVRAEPRGSLGLAIVHAGVHAEIVELCRHGDRSVGQIAKNFELTETAVRLWVSQAEVDAGERDDLTSGEREELRRENSVRAT